MNQRGQLALVGLMIGVMIFFVAMIFIHPLTEVIQEVRGTDQLDCANISISDGRKATCLIIDATLPYFIVMVIAVAGGWMAAKFV